NGTRAEGTAGGFSAEDILKEIFGSGKASRGDPFQGDQFGRASGFGTGAQGQQTAQRGADAEATLFVSLEDLARDEKVRLDLPTGKTVSVSVPKGVEDGQVIRLKGQGYGSGGGGDAGDALITVQIRKHALFERDGTNLRINLPVTLYEAVLGAKVKVPTLSGQVALTLPKGTSSGQVFRIKERGLFRKDKTRGDIFARVEIVLPKDGSSDLDTMMKVWRDQRPYKVRGTDFE
ncbi:MAG: J domain-containing protein, partial [Pseudomonadota bacterium]